MQMCVGFRVRLVLCIFDVTDHRLALWAAGCLCNALPTTSRSWMGGHPASTRHADGRWVGRACGDEVAFVRFGMAGSKRMIGMNACDVFVYKHVCEIKARPRAHPRTCHAGRFGARALWGIPSDSRSGSGRKSRQLARGACPRHRCRAWPRTAGERGPSCRRAGASGSEARSRMGSAATAPSSHAVLSMRPAQRWRPGSTI